MHLTRKRHRRPINVLLLVALLLVPVALSGHAHAGPVTHPCSICAVTHHAPIVNTPAMPPLATQVVVRLWTPPSAPARVSLDRAPRTGRAPPLAVTVVA
jgi:hypothetical protein